MAGRAVVRVAGRGRSAACVARPRWALLVACVGVVGAAGLVGCDRTPPGSATARSADAASSAGRPASEPVPSQVRQVLDRRARAVLEHDEGGYGATGGSGRDAAAAHRAATEFDNLAAVPLAAWAYRVTGFHRTGATARVDAEVRYRIDGYDIAPALAARTLRLRRTDGRWYVTSDRPAAHAPQQLWEQGRVTVVTGAHSLVLGVGQDRRRLTDLARFADRAVRAVQDAWGGAAGARGAGGGGPVAPPVRQRVGSGGWPGRVMVRMPASLDDMAGLLAAPPTGYRDIAAVTTGEVSGSRQAPSPMRTVPVPGHAGARTARTARKAPGTPLSAISTPSAPQARITVNPDAYGQLSDLGRQVVLTHETAHVATRAATSPATPLWLSEGYADWVGYRGTGRSAAQAAPELQRAVRGGRVPKALPDDADFGFSRPPDPLAEAYEGGWLACRMIADHWDEARLNAFYAAVGAHRTRTGAVDAALRDVLGVGSAQFIEQWRGYLRDELG